MLREGFGSRAKVKSKSSCKMKEKAFIVLKVETEVLLIIAAS